MRKVNYLCEPRNRRRKHRSSVKRDRTAGDRARKNSQRLRRKALLRDRVHKYRQNDPEFYRTSTVSAFLQREVETDSWKRCCSPPEEPIRTYRKECSIYCGDEDISNLECLDCGHWAHPECLEHLLRTFGSSCPLCKSSIDHMRTDEHYRAIDDYIEEQYQEDLEAAIAASLAMSEAAGQNESSAEEAAAEPEEAALGQDESDPCEESAEAEEEVLGQDEIDPSAEAAEAENALGQDEIDPNEEEEVEKVELNQEEPNPWLNSPWAKKNCEEVAVEVVQEAVLGKDESE